MARPGRRAPADRHAAPVGGEQIEAAIDRDLEGEARAGAERQHAHAALRPVGELDQLDARELLQRAGALGELGPGQLLPVELDHRASHGILLRICLRADYNHRALRCPALHAAAPTQARTGNWAWAFTSGWSCPG